MTKKEARNILLAHACCMINDVKICRECPWRNTKDCENTSFADVLEEAIYTSQGEEITEMNLSDIKITSAFLNSTPRKKKMDECLLYWIFNGKQDRYLVVNKNGYLIDGYVMYCVLKKEGVETAKVRVSKNSKKQKDWRSAKYRNNPTTYIFGTHQNSNDTNTYMWRVPESWGNWADDVQIGDVIFGVTKRGCSPVVVTKIEVLDKCPVRFPVKRVANKQIRRNGEVIHE